MTMAAVDCASDWRAVSRRAPLGRVRVSNTLACYSPPAAAPSAPGRAVAACRRPLRQGELAGGGEERELRLALAAQHGEVDLDAVDRAGAGEHERLRLDDLGGEDAAAARL